jgi:hypothetical protein
LLGGDQSVQRLCCFMFPGVDRGVSRLCEVLTCLFCSGGGGGSSSSSSSSEKWHKIFSV